MGKNLKVGTGWVELYSGQMSDSSHKKRKWDDPGQEISINKHTKVDDAESDKISAKIKSILAQSNLNSDAQRDIHDGAFVKDIEINDVKNRYTLTRGVTQSEIQRDTGADVTTRGIYYPDKSQATDRDPPLYLHITATDQMSLDNAVRKIEDLIEAAENPPARPPPRPRPEGTRFEARVPVGMESVPHFNLRAKLVGMGGENVKFIQEKSGCAVRLKGKGSGYYEQNTGVESEEPLYVHISSWVEENIAEAKVLTQNLVDSVKQEYTRFKESRGSYGRGNYGRSYGGYDSYNYGYGAPPPPPPPPMPSMPPPLPYSEGAAPTGADAQQAQSAYPGYDYSQYYAYYGQYDPNYYNYSDPSAQQAQASQPPPPPPPEESQQHSGEEKPPPPPTSETTSTEKEPESTDPATKEESSGKSDSAATPPPPPPPSEH